MFEAPPLHKVQEAIASPTSPIGMRMRAAYYLRQAYENHKRNKNEEDDEHDDDVVKESKEEQEQEQEQQDNCNFQCKAVDEIVIDTLCKGLRDERHGSLLRHEFAYVMGQIRDERVSIFIKYQSLYDLLRIPSSYSKRSSLASTSILDI